MYHYIYVYYKYFFLNERRIFVTVVIWRQLSSCQTDTRLSMKKNRGIKFE